MTLPKKIIDNSVGYVNKDNHSNIEQPPPISKERMINASKKTFTE